MAGVYGKLGMEEVAAPVAPPKQQGMAIPSGRYYETYHGHEPERLELVLRSLREAHSASAASSASPSVAVFLAGDSSLDNKTWLFNQGALAERWRPSSAHAEAVNGYERILSPPRMVRDVSYWMNRYLAESGSHAFCVNSAVEATLLASRVGGFHTCVCPTIGGLYEQDEFIRDNIEEQDMLVISVGGNDVALAPSIFTVVFLALLMLTPWPLLGPWHPAVAYFVLLFRHSVQRYAELLTERTRPARVGVCMVYNLDERNGDSWANGALCALCYCCFPSLLQARMRLMYELGTALVTIEGTEVVPIHLAEALDGKCPEDYHHRVEPSVQGGRKMAQLILRRLGFAV